MCTIQLIGIPIYFSIAAVVQLYNPTLLYWVLLFSLAPIITFLNTTRAIQYATGVLLTAVLIIYQVIFMVVNHADLNLVVALPTGVCIFSELLTCAMAYDTDIMNYSFAQTVNFIDFHTLFTLYPESKNNYTKL